jgi:hypothetical protein
LKSSDSRLDSLSKLLQPYFLMEKWMKKLL